MSHRIRPRFNLSRLHPVSLSSGWLVLLVSVAISTLLSGVRQLGLLQSLELGAFDQLLQLRPDQGPDPRLLVVTVTEADIQARQEDPLSDRTLAQLLQELARYQPRVMGLDIYRDISQEPGHADLTAQLRQSDRIITVCKSPGNDTEIPPPPGIPSDRLSFSDIVVDPGGIVRRSLLAITPLDHAKCAAPYSFGLQVARHYLQAQNIELFDHEYLGFGSTALRPLEANSGGYQGIDARGYQVLLNYRSRDRVAQQVTLSQVLEGKINPNWVKDRIVLIGYAAASKRDAFYTPYSSGQPQNQQMPGVIVHAQMVSQLLGTVLDHQPLFWFWPQWGEVLWIWGWAVVGGSLAWCIRHPLRLGLAEGASLGVLCGICFGLLTQAGWIPLVPPALALVGTGGSVIAYKVLYDALFDALTGLPNRTLFIDRLRNSIRRAQRHRSAEAASDATLSKLKRASINSGAASNLLAVLCLNLDGFKVVNESFGLMVGDELLTRVVQRLKASLRPGDLVARLGGDEFTILLQSINDLSEAVRIADRLQNTLTLPFKLGAAQSGSSAAGSCEVYIGASIGIAASTGSDDQPEDLLRNAHTAMHRAKAQGPLHHEVFDPDMRVQVQRRLQLEADLRQAIERQEFLLHYQPIVFLETGRISGFEALVRWQRPTPRGVSDVGGGLVSPAVFIPVAEETGLIIPIGQWVLYEACHQMCTWQQLPHLERDLPLMISVNLSGKQFSQPDLLPQIEQTLQETGLAAHCLKLEITESVVMTNVESAIAMLLQMKALHVQLSIDDFGTGYSSLSTLYRFPIDTLKIDRSFVSRLDNDAESVKIAQTIVALAHNLGMDVVAEGVETAEQLAHLKALNCEYAQGYFFSRPLDTQAAAALIAANPQW